jgi:hypothetical protein
MPPASGIKPSAATAKTTQVVAFRSGALRKQRARLFLLFLLEGLRSASCKRERRAAKSNDEIAPPHGLLAFHPATRLALARERCYLKFETMLIAGSQRRP